MSSNPFDIKALYQAGYSSVYDPTKDKSDRNNAINTILGFALEKTGQWAVSRYKQNYAELKELKAMGRANKTAVQMEMNKVGGILSPQMQQALTQFKKEYDKGARMSVKGFTGKRKMKGQEMMDAAYAKMTTLSQSLKNVNAEMQTQMDNGMHELGERAEGSERSGWSNGSTVTQLENSIQLATGKMLTNLEVDLNTGEINYLTQEDADVSEQSYNEYVKSVGGGGGVLSQDEWALTQQANMPINKTSFTKVDWAQEDDQTIGDQMADLYDKAEKEGLKGGVINEYDTQKRHARLNKIFRDGSDNAIRSFMFGSEVSVMVDGKLQMITPAMKMLIDQGYKPGDANAAEGSKEKKQYNEFQGALTDLRDDDFSKGSKYREKLLNITSDSIEAYQQNGKNEYDAKQEIAQQDKPNTNPTKQSEKVINVDGTGSYMPRQDAKRKAQKLVEPNSITFGGQYKYVNDGAGNVSVYFAVQDDVGNITYKLRETMTVNQALDFRNLDGLGYEVKEAKPKSENNDANESESFEEYDPSRNTDIPEKLQVTVNGEIRDVTKLNNNEVNQLSQEDKFKWLQNSYEL